MTKLKKHSFQGAESSSLFPLFPLFPQHKPALVTFRLSLSRLLMTIMYKPQLCSLYEVEMSYLNSKESSPI